MILKIVFIVLAGGLVAAAVTRAMLRARQQRAAQVPELNQHPERLDQMLDATDDA
jgi:hypothetical protein